MADYITLGGFKSRFGVNLDDKNARLAEHITAASRKADAICYRSFASHDGVASVRHFRPDDAWTVWVDDAYDITALGVDDDDDGTYGTEWVAADYETFPDNGIGPDGQAGWPTTTLRAVGSLVFPTCYRRRTIAVTAKWGWPAVPDDVVEAVYQMAARLSYEVGVPSGVTPPNIDFGLPGSPLQPEYTARRLLAPYVRPDRKTGVA